MTELDIKRNFTLDIDSELNVQGCSCSTETKSTWKCKKYTVLVRACFTLDGLKQCFTVSRIHQCKGEPEMSQIDWMMDSLNDLTVSDAVISTVSSGDIDSLVIHLFFVSKS